MGGRWKWYALILLGIAAVPAVILPFVLDFSRPEFQSVDDVDPANVGQLEVRLFNLKAVVPPPAEGETTPDTVGPFVVRREDVATILGLLKGARKVDEMPTGPFLGQFAITLNTGRTQRIRVKFSGNPARPESLSVWFRIANRLDFEAKGTAREFVATIVKAEKKVATR
jgi:hypothetical protein